MKTDVDTLESKTPKKPKPDPNPDLSPLPDVSPAPAPADEKVQYFSDGHYWCEIDPINSSSAEDEQTPDTAIYYKPPTRIKFSRDPIKQFSTYSIDDYDRRNEELDPVAASAEYELEKRVEKMDAFQVNKILFFAIILNSLSFTLIMEL